MRYQEAYPGVNLIYHGNPGELEYDFEVAPRTDPSVIRLAIAADDSPSVAASPKDNSARTAENAAASRVPLEIDEQGNLVIKLARGEVRFRKPAIYHLPAGQVPGQKDEQALTSVVARRPLNGAKLIDGHYVLKGPHEVGFAVASYDRTRPLIIDPALVYSTYVGPSGAGGSAGIGVDASGNVYVAGGLGTNSDDGIYVVGLSKTGNTTLYTTYLGSNRGSSLTIATSIAVDLQGDAYISGTTQGPGFPTTPGAFMTTCGGCPNSGIAAKLSPSGSLVYSTYLGEVQSDARGIAVDGLGHAYITGAGGSGFPMVNAFLGSPAGTYVLELNPQGSGAVYSTFIGGTSGTSIAVIVRAMPMLWGWVQYQEFLLRIPWSRLPFRGLPRAFSPR